VYLESRRPILAILKEEMSVQRHRTGECLALGCDVLV
jgi:hypothetical protein